MQSENIIVAVNAVDQGDITENSISVVFVSVCLLTEVYCQELQNQAGKMLVKCFY